MKEKAHILCKIIGHNWLSCYSGRYHNLLSRLCKRCDKAEYFESNPMHENATWN
jgi:hypothetical protein